MKKVHLSSLIPFIHAVSKDIEVFERINLAILVLVIFTHKICKGVISSAKIIARPKTQQTIYTSQLGPDPVS